MGWHPRHARGGRSLALGALAACLLLAACGGSPSSGQASRAPAARTSSGSGPVPASGSGGGTRVFSGSISLTGAVVVSGDWTDDAEAWAGSCQSWATQSRVGAGPLNVPGPGGPQGASVGGHMVGLAFVFSTYAGPGSYTHDPANKGLEVDGHVYGPPSSYTLKVAPDGSGSLTFSNAANPLASSQVLSGSESWTCK
jgi:hypothetical protein